MSNRLGVFAALLATGCASALSANAPMSAPGPAANASSSADSQTESAPLGDEETVESIQLGVLLTADADLPAPEAIIEAATKMGLPGMQTVDTGAEAVLGFVAPSGEGFLLKGIPTKHPEAEDMPRGLLSPSPEAISSAPAHVVIVMMDGRGTVREQDILVARFTAAVGIADQAPAAMLGHGTMFYRTDVFAEVAADPDTTDVPLTLGVDITIAPEPDGRTSLLTHGLGRHAREDFHVFFPGGKDQLLDAYAFTSSLSHWMIVDPNKVLPTGDTVGRSEEERIKIQRAPSPIDGSAQVIKLELPAPSATESPR